MHRRLKLPYPFMMQWPYKDQFAWSNALQDHGIFEKSSGAVRWSQSTLYNVALNYSQWVNFNRRYYEERDPNPEDRVTEERVAAFVRDIARRTSSFSTFSTRVGQLKMAMTAIVPDRDWSWLSKSVSHLRGTSVKSGRKNIIQTIDSNALYDLGIDLMEGATLSQENPLARALVFRDGLMIAMMSRRPIRRKNLAMIRLHKHLCLIGSKWYLLFSKKETKQRKPYEVPLPAEFNDFLDRFLAIHRKHIGNSDDHDFLWASAKGGGLSKQGCYEVIAKRTKKAFGSIVSPHLFRDCLVTTIARHAPANIGVASTLLGHANPEVTEKHYNQARSLEASNQYGSFIEELKGKVLLIVE